MVKKTDNPNPDFVNNIRESAQQIWLAGLGAFAKAQAEGGKVFENLVQEGTTIQRKTAGGRRGEVRRHGRALERLAGDVTSKAGQQWDKLESIFEDRTARALTRLGVAERETGGRPGGPRGRAGRAGGQASEGGGTGPAGGGEAVRCAVGHVHGGREAVRAQARRALGRISGRPEGVPPVGGEPRRARSSSAKPGAVPPGRAPRRAAPGRVLPVNERSRSSFACMNVVTLASSTSTSPWFAATAGSPAAGLRRARGRRWPPRPSSAAWRGLRRTSR